MTAICSTSPASLTAGRLVCCRSAPVLTTASVLRWLGSPWRRASRPLDLGPIRGTEDPGDRPVAQSSVMRPQRVIAEQA